MVFVQLENSWKVGAPGGSTFDTGWSTWDDRDHNLKSTIITKNMSQFQVMFSRSGGTKKWSKWTPGAPTFQLFSSCTKTMKSTIVVDFYWFWRSRSIGNIIKNHIFSEIGFSAAPGRDFVPILEIISDTLGTELASVSYPCAPQERLFKHNFF